MIDVYIRALTGPLLVVGPLSHPSNYRGLDSKLTGLLSTVSTYGLIIHSFSNCQVSYEFMLTKCKITYV